MLQPQEFLELLSRCGLKFPADVVLEIFLKADTNQDGVIQYEEFIPAMKAIIAGAKKATAAAPAPAAAAGAMPALADVPPAMLKRYLQKLFAVADVNGDGVLQPAEFKRLLELSGFNFPPATIRKLLNAADVNHDGVIEYDEFIPAMKAIIAGAKEAQPSVAAKCAPARSAPAAQKSAMLNNYTVVVHISLLHQLNDDCRLKAEARAR